MNKKTNIKSGKNHLKRFIVKAGFLSLGRAIESTSRFEKDVIKEIKDWPEGFSFNMMAIPLGPGLAMEKKNGSMRILKKPRENPDLIVEIKTIGTAFKMIITLIGAHEVYAQHKIGVIGNVADSMKFIRIVYNAQAYLFPKFLHRNILKKSPKMGLKKQINRLHIYTIGMLLGR